MTSKVKTQRQLQVNERIKRIIAETTKQGHYEAEIKGFNYGNDYYMMVKEVFSDVRFVGTPPNSIGKFG